MQYLKLLDAAIFIQKLPTSSGSASDGGALFFFLAAAGGIAIWSACAGA
jgi:hypothetical protein